MYQIQWPTLIVVEFLQNPRLHLRTAVRERDPVKIVLDDSRRLGVCLLDGGILGSGGNGRCGDGFWLRLTLGLLLWRRSRLREILFQQRLRSKNNNKGEGEHEEQSSLHARILLRIRKFCQFCVVSLLSAHDQRCVRTMN